MIEVRVKPSVALLEIPEVPYLPVFHEGKLGPSYYLLYSLVHFRGIEAVLLDSWVEFANEGRL